MEILKVQLKPNRCGIYKGQLNIEAIMEAKNKRNEQFWKQEKKMQNFCIFGVGKPERIITKKSAVKSLGNPTLSPAVQPQ